MKRRFGFLPMGWGGILLFSPTNGYKGVAIIVIIISVYLHSSFERRFGVKQVFNLRQKCLKYHYLVLHSTFYYTLPCIA